MYNKFSTFLRKAHTKVFRLCRTVNYTLLKSELAVALSKVSRAETVVASLLAALYFVTIALTVATGLWVLLATLANTMIKLPPVGDVMVGVEHAVEGAKNVAENVVEVSDGAYSGKEEVVSEDESSLIGWAKSWVSEHKVLSGVVLGLIGLTAAGLVVYYWFFSGGAGSGEVAELISDSNSTEAKQAVGSAVSSADSASGAASSTGSAVVVDASPAWAKGCSVAEVLSKGTFSNVPKTMDETDRLLVDSVVEHVMRNSAMGPAYYDRNSWKDLAYGFHGREHLLGLELMKLIETAPPGKILVKLPGHPGVGILI